MVLEISTSNENISGIVFLEISDTMFRYKIRDKNIYDTDELFFETESKQIGPPETGIVRYPFYSYFYSYYLLFIITNCESMISEYED